MTTDDLEREVARLRGRLAEQEDSDRALRESQAHLRVITDSVPVLISYIDSSLTYRFVNREYERWFGQSRQDLIGRRVPDVLEPSAYARSKPFLDRVLQGEDVEFEGRAERPDGSVKHFLTRCVPDRGDDGTVRGYFAVVSDITDIRQATEALSASERRLRSIVEGVPVVLWSLDADGVFTLSEGRGLRALGLRPGQVVGRSVHEVYAGAPEVLACVRRALAGEAHSTTLRIDDAVFDVHVEPLVEAGGGVDGMIGVAADITERVRMAERLEASEARYRELVEEISDVIYEVDADGTVTYISPAMTPVSGYGADEVLGRPFADFIHPEDVARVRASFRDVVAGGGGQLTELRVVTRDGDVRWMQTTSRPVRGGGGIVGVRGVLVDMTERRTLERELARLERLRALGEMSAGISHNLNNILVGVLGPAELLKETVEDPKVTAIADEILAAGERARALVERLGRTVRGQGEAGLQPVPLNEHVREAVQMARPRWKDDAEARGLRIEVDVDLGEVPPIAATSSEADEVLINLIFNAVDAMPGGGKITVRTRPAGDLVELTVADTGVGMDEDTRQRLFEPFFTTKMEVGSGLGLATVFGSVSRWGGSVDVDSAPGQGATFHLRLPVWREPAVAVASAGAAVGGRVASLLVVDDDAASRRVLVRALSGRHRVEACQGAREALARFAPGRFDVAIVDLGMPGMPGDQLVAHLRRIDPDLGTVLITGWDLAAGDPRLQAFDLWLKKPFGEAAHLNGVVSQAVALRDGRVAGRSGGG